MKSITIFAETYARFILHLYSKVPIKSVPISVDAKIWLSQNWFTGFVRPLQGVTDGPGRPAQKDEKSENSNTHNFLLP